MEWFKNLSPRDKVLVIGGGALVLFFLFKALTGHSQTAQTGYTQDTSNQNQTSPTDQTNGLTQGLLQMMSGFQQSQTQAFIQLEQTLQASAQNQQSQISTLISQMSKPINYNSPTAGGSSVPGNAKESSNSIAPGSSVPLFTSAPHQTTKDDLSRIVGTSVGPSGNGLVTLKTENGFTTVLAGSVFDPSSGNYDPSK